MKILITSCAGFIERALTAKFAGLGRDIIALDILTPQIHGAGSAV
jgi:nucleoside-diphosphate-sugar epimerase